MNLTHNKYIQILSMGSFSDLNKILMHNCGACMQCLNDVDGLPIKGIHCYTQYIPGFLAYKHISHTTAKKNGNCRIINHDILLSFFFPFIGDLDLD